MEKKPITYLSTFSGIGGFEKGIQLAYDNRPNIRNGSEVLQEIMPDSQESQNRPTCIGYSEIDKYASQIYQSHFPYEQCQKCKLETIKRGEERGGHGVAQTIDTGMQQHTLQNSQIRRLTPTECERLQGFSDGWTEGVSDTQRYKTLGNAVTVNVIRDIMEKLLLKQQP